ncbi:VOC family protein [Acinetobacter sp. S4400-12]
MHARISIIKFAGRDLAAALDFYREGLGLSSEGVIGEEFD